MTSGSSLWQRLPRDGRRGLPVGTIAYAAAFWLRAAAGEAMDGMPFAPFFLAVLATAIVGGSRAASLVALAALLTAWHQFLPPRQSWALEWPLGPAALGFFAQVAAAEIVFVELLFRKMAKLAQEQRRVNDLLALHRALHRELHHRVANGIQSLASAMTVQANLVTQADEAGDALHDAARRLRAVAVTPQYMC